MSKLSYEFDEVCESENPIRFATRHDETLNSGIEHAVHLESSPRIRKRMSKTGFFKKDGIRPKTKSADSPHFSELRQNRAAMSARRSVSRRNAGKISLTCLNSEFLEKSADKYVIGL